jgi:hypothetical protein
MSNAIKIFLVFALLLANLLVWQKALETKRDSHVITTDKRETPVLKTKHNSCDTVKKNVGYAL